MPEAPRETADDDLPNGVLWLRKLADGKWARAEVYNEGMLLHVCDDGEGVTRISREEAVKLAHAILARKS